MRKLVYAQFVVLLAGTLFAWGNFGYGFINWLNEKACDFKCTAGLTNPFLTPCFYGALFFTAAFVLSALMVRILRK